MGASDKLKSFWNRVPKWLKALIILTFIAGISTIAVVISSINNVTKYEVRLIDPHSCNYEAALMVGELYAYSNPFMNQSEIRDFVLENRYLLSHNSNVIGCMKKLGNLFVQLRYTRFSHLKLNEDTIEKYFYDMAEDFKIYPMSIADSVIKNMRSDTIRLFFVGQELLWLADVIPDAANDNWYKYECTGTSFRRMTIEALINYKPFSSVYDFSDQEMTEFLGSLPPEAKQWNNEYGMWHVIFSGVHLGVFE